MLQHNLMCPSLRSFSPIKFQSQLQNPVKRRRLHPNLKSFIWYYSLYLICTKDLFIEHNRAWICRVGYLHPYKLPMRSSLLLNLDGESPIVVLFLVHTCKIIALLTVQSRSLGSYACSLVGASLRHFVLWRLNFAEIFMQCVFSILLLIYIWQLLSLTLKK